ncbi:Aminodeoxychorismate lyase [hydrothermal vent metagenome]|uniref:aminodeoxychorismate lyase n=1 Tax=hydrothermal vent metagenome TaxID=652676 RepID=A0A3B0VFM5_9ZZZZ
MKFYTSFQITPENCLNNRAINYGDGVFETIFVCGKAMPLWKLHWQRLESSLRRLQIAAIDECTALNKILSLVNDNDRYIAKLVVFRDDTKRGYGSQSDKANFYITLTPYLKTTIDESLTISSVTLSKQKILAGIKHLNRLEQVMAAQELNNRKYNDALMCDKDGYVIETINKNIVFIKNEQLYTPQLDGSGVYGVALRWLQLQANKSEYKLNWKKIEITSLSQYHGMMVCNSIVGFKSIINIDNNIHFKSTSAIAEKIKLHWQEYMKSP